MTATSYRRWVSFFVPDAFLLGAALVALRLPALHGSLPAAARLFPVIVGAVGALIAWRLERGRLFFALLVLAVSLGAIEVASSGPSARASFGVVMILLPINLAALCLRLDRGIFTRGGLTTFSLIAVEVVALALLIRYRPGAVVRIVDHPVLAASALRWLPVSQVGILAFAGALIAVVTPLAFEANAVGRSFVWAILASLAAVLARHPGPGAGILLGTAGLIVVVVTVETSHRLAYQDALTGLPGRRALTEAVQQLGNEFAVAMIDVDHFKRFNDQYGHDAGDQILKMVATKLSHIGGDGRAFRYGGEEFAIVFPGQTTPAAFSHVDAARRAIADTRFVVRRRLRRKSGPRKTPRSRPVAVSVTISAGVATPQGKRSSPEEVLREADRKLYAAKEGGRNQVRY
jgi:diguanylate cyclase (GGDEF)-like protein